MASENGQGRRETLADIVAMLRANARGERFDEFSFTSLADRIEAAWEREKAESEADALAVGGIVEAERHTPGNAAAVRKALRQIKQMGIELRNIIPHLDKNWEECLKASIRIYQTAERALLEPPRNCDVGTPEEQYKRYSAFTSRWTPCSFNGHARCAGDCPVNKKLERDGSGDLQCPFVWAQMPYAEERKGESDGRK